MSRKCDLLAVGVMSGNNVSHSNRKTKRKFLPNLKHVSLKSECLGANVNLKVATSTLRTINKYGNIDNFLVNCRFSKLTIKGQSLRNKIKKKLIKTEKLDEVKISKEDKNSSRFVSARKKLKKS